MEENYIPPCLPHPTLSNLSNMGKPQGNQCVDIAILQFLVGRVASYIPGGYDLLLGQDFLSPSKIQQSGFPNPSSYSLGMRNSQEPPFIPLPVPPEYSVQWPSPSKQISKPSPVPGPAPVPVPRHPIDLLPGDPKINSQSLPAPLECTVQCQALSIPNGEQSPNPIPGPVSEQAPDLHLRDPSLGPLSLASLVPPPVLVRETDSPDHSGSSPTCAASQPVPELVIATYMPPMSSRTSSSPSQSSADENMSKNSAIPLLANELYQLQRLGAEPVMNAPAPAIKEADPGGTTLSSSGFVLPIPLPRKTVNLQWAQGRKSWA
ncbi:uncharacterized protein [Macrobrachium rosenbergii]|uniref:uncharacterized protein n=1 Tax=Macrobrachium rosenbergii TaxID=79674 RepID=UPI0034D77AA4